MLWVVRSKTENTEHGKLVTKERIIQREIIQQMEHESSSGLQLLVLLKSWKCDTMQSLVCCRRRRYPIFQHSRVCDLVNLDSEGAATI